MRDVLIVANTFGVQFVCVNQFKLISESILKLIQRFACMISQITFMLVYVLYIMCHDKQQHLLLLCVFLVHINIKNALNAFCEHFCEITQINL